MPATISAQIKAMYDDQGRVNAEAVAEGLGVSTTTIARAFGLKPDTLRKNPVAESIQEPGQRLVALLEELTSYFDNDLKSAMIWMRRPHPDLEDVSPLKAMEEGGLDVVESLVHAIGTGQLT